jgi:hypothetical protein
MSDNDIWQHDNLRVEDGMVAGSARTRMKGGVDVQAAVTSYEYERQGRQMANHVPHVVVLGEGGRIHAEPHARDSTNPNKAIENAKSLGEYTFKNLSEFTLD